MSNFPSSQPLFFVSGSGSPGGAERQLANLLNHLPHQHIHLLILNDNTFLESLINNDRVSITYSHSRSLISVFLSFCQQLRAVPCSRLTIVGWMAKANLFVLFASYFLLPFKSSSVIWNHRSSFFLYQSIYSQILLFASLFLSLLSFKKITHVSNSHTVFSPLLVKLMLLGPKFVIPNGYDFSSGSTLSKFRLPSRLLRPDEKLLLLCPARFSPEKGHQLLFQALERVPFDFHITLIGTGCNYNNLKLLRLISKVRDKVSLVEHTSFMDQQYLNHHYTVLFSSSESFPNVLIESMALRVPCICSNVGDSKAIVGSFGFVLKNRSVTEACKTLCSAYTICLSSSSYSDLCSGAMSYVVNKYTADQMSKSFSALF